MKQWQYFVLVMTLLSVAGCGTKGGEKPTQTEEELQTSIPILDNLVSDAQTDSVDDQNAIDGQGLDQVKEVMTAPSNNIIYFDYDKSEVRLEQQALLEQHARYLVANPAVNVRLEGHADERGSVEYNFALGERRAEAVKRMVNILGVANGNLSTLSYGEEMPIERGHDEMSWEKNRRVELIYH